ncbi:MAG: hypothetical protein R3236_07480 [Phycisphaeraceae bacterium]|nr:hypothetical protein [Phycisphaeraceae bacterium]
MNRKHLAGLVLINVVLLAAMAIVSVMPADAQNRQRRRGDYMLVSSEVRGNSSIVYVYDTANRELIALSYNGRGKLEVAAPAHSIGADLQKLGRIRK